MLWLLLIDIPLLLPPLLPLLPFGLEKLSPALPLCSLEVDSDSLILSCSFTARSRRNSLYSYLLRTYLSMTESDSSVLRGIGCLLGSGFHTAFALVFPNSRSTCLEFKVIQSQHNAFAGTKQRSKAINDLQEGRSHTST